MQIHAPYFLNCWFLHCTQPLGYGNLNIIDHTPAWAHMGFIFLSFFFSSLIGKKSTIKISENACLKIIFLHLMTLSRSAEWGFTLHSRLTGEYAKIRPFKEKQLLGVQHWQLRNQSSLLAPFGEQGERTKGHGGVHVPAVPWDTVAGPGHLQEGFRARTMNFLWSSSGSQDGVRAAGGVCGYSKLRFLKQLLTFELIHADFVTFCQGDNSILKAPGCCHFYKPGVGCVGRGKCHK